MLIRDSQHGFRKGRSCLTNLLVFLDEVTESINDGISVDVIFLANVNSRSRSLYAIARPSVVCLSSVCLSVVGNTRAPYSADCNFGQYFYGVRYLGHPLTSTENFTEIVPREPLRRGR